MVTKRCLTTLLNNLNEQYRVHSRLCGRSLPRVLVFLPVLVCSWADPCPYVTSEAVRVGGRGVQGREGLTSSHTI